LALAVFPSSVAVARDNGVDTLLIFLMLAACGVALVAIESGRTRTLLASAVLVGLAFNTKSLAAFLCVPGIAFAYLLCAPGSVRRRLAQLSGAGVVLVVVSLSWAVAVDLTPAASRPYVGSSSDNSELGLAFGYNGFGRVGGETGAPGSIPNAGGSASVPLVSTSNPPVSVPARVDSEKRASAHIAAAAAVSTGRQRRQTPDTWDPTASPWRVLGDAFGDQDGWTIPLALVGLVGLVIALLAASERSGSARAAKQRGWFGRLAAAAVATRRDARSATLYVLGGWFLVELVTIDFARGIVHPYYASALGPGVAAMAGAGAVAIAALIARRGDGAAAEQRTRRRGLALAVLAVLCTAGFQLVLIQREDYPEYWRIPLVVLSLAGLAAVFLLPRRAPIALYASTVVLLVAPGIYSTSVWDAPVAGTFPAAGPYSYAGHGGYGVPKGALAVNRTLIAYIRSHHPSQRFQLLVESSDVASPLILLGLHAAASGGYNANDPAMSADSLAHLVATDQARYFLIGGPYASRGGNGASTAARLVCPEVLSKRWLPAGASPPFYLVDCRGRAPELRHAIRWAAAYIAAERRRGVIIHYPL
jgi:4-amino-4-deoxy-L-arabinose transferase-like glycosyltransferase